MSKSKRPPGRPPQAPGVRTEKLYDKLKGSLCQWHDDGLYTGVFINHQGKIATVRPIGPYGRHPRNKKIPLSELIFP